MAIKIEVEFGRDYHQVELCLRGGDEYPTTDDPRGGVQPRSFARWSVFSEEAMRIRQTILMRSSGEICRQVEFCWNGWLQNLPREDDEDPRRTIPCGAAIGRVETSGTITRNEGLRCFINVAEKKAEQGLDRTNPGSPDRVDRARPFRSDRMCSSGRNRRASCFCPIETGSIDRVDRSTLFLSDRLCGKVQETLCGNCLFGLNLLMKVTLSPI